ncbi:MAG: hypothetical protein D6753_11300 [Planctomycetota bacterium]|nr:MAG: hypothetical protein D6753_11300 [Planctomycetota bacterium]
METFSTGEALQKKEDFLEHQFRMPRKSFFDGETALPEVVRIFFSHRVTGACIGDAYEMAGNGTMRPSAIPIG